MRDDILLKIQRANKHIDELHIVLRAFIDSNPYGISLQVHPETGEKFYFLCKDAEIPDDVPVIAGDVLQNLRSALDYLAWRLVDANGGSPGKHTYFPIFDDAAKYQSGFSGPVKGMRQEAINLIHSLKPYQGGNNSLWRLHRLNNIDKHRLVFTVGARIGNFDAVQHLKASNPPGEDFARKARAIVTGWSTGDWSGMRINPSTSLKKGDVLMVDSADAKVNENIKMTINVVLNEPGICEGEPLILVLRRSWQVVLRTVQKFEALI